jgi:predicted Fe-Mo cluster-binding NifX family protein
MPPSENLASMMKSINNKMDEFAQLFDSYIVKYSAMREKVLEVIKNFDQMEAEATRAKLIEIVANMTVEPLGQSFEQLSKFVSYNQAKKKKKTLIHSVSVNLPKNSSKIIAVNNKTFDHDDHSVSSLGHHEYDEDICSEWTHKGVVFPEHFKKTGRNRAVCYRQGSSMLYTFNNLSSTKKIESIKKLRHETSADIMERYL